MNEELKQTTNHLLVVDDDDLILFLYKEFLEGLNYEITTCSNGIDALALFEASPSSYDLIITDQMMPDMTGKELINKLLALGYHQPYILSSGYIDSISDNDAQMSASHFLQKPVHLDVLKQTVEKCLEAA